MKGKRVFSRTVVLLLALLLAGVQSVPSALAASSASMTTKGGEADAARWGTWVLESADELRPAGPPDAEATAAEMAELMAMTEMRDAEAAASVHFWDAGAPGYRWIEMTIAPYRAGPPNPGVARALALLNVAIYDATMATWDAKYAFNRPRPAGLSTLISIPSSPSYPDEYAAAAGAASAVLAYLFPDKAEMYAAQAEEAGHSRLIAGVAYPSDVETGLAIGRAVGEKVVALTMTDGSDAKWDGTRPAGPGILTTENPVFPMSGTWRAWTLESNDQFRSAPPPAHDSEQTLAELTEIKAITRTFPIASKAMQWHTFDAAYTYWFDAVSLGLFEAKLDHNPPQAALAYSAMSVANFDAVVACFDSKYAYWRIRPNQLDPEVTTLFATPPHPSYPAAHACASTANANVIADFFPAQAESILAAGAEAGQSRIWAGIHYRSDVDAGSVLGKDVAQWVLAHVDEMTDTSGHSGSPQFGSKSWKIAVAMTGGPYGIAKDSTILDWPVAGADPVVLREGTNGWVCRPDHPATPTNDPRCFDPNWRKLFPMDHGSEREALNLLGFGYMLQWGDAADHDDYNLDEPGLDADWVLDGPHLMINISGDFDHSYMAHPEDGGPYVMFHDFSQAHLMIPTPLEQVVPSDNPIYDAMSAAPLRVSENARVVDWPTEASGGEFIELRAGTNGWTCLADDPGTPAHDPMCLDENFMEFIHALMEGRDPVYAGVGVGYMLRGGSGASNTDYTLTEPPAGEDWMIDPPHLMFVVPWDLDPALYSTDPMSGGPYIMWEGTPYEHIMAPVVVK